MATLLVRNLQTMITCDDSDAVLNHVDLYCEDGVIRAIGPNLPQAADTVIDGSHCWCYPGLINTHHHLYQVFSRNLPQLFLFCFLFISNTFSFHGIAFAEVN